MSGPSRSGNITVTVNNNGASHVCFFRRQASSDEEVLLVSARETRKGVIIYNESVSTLYIKFGAGVTKESFTVKIPPDATYEMSTSLLWGGDIYGIWDQADGYAHITQLV